MSELNPNDPFSWIGDGGQPEDAMKANDDAFAAEVMAQMEFARLVFEVFNSGRGPELLASLRDSTIEKPMMLVSGGIGDGIEVSISPSDWVYWRDGQNSVIRMIEQNMRLAMNPPATQGNEEDA